MLVRLIIGAVISSSMETAFAEPISMKGIRAAEGSHSQSTVSSAGAIGYYQVTPVVMREYNDANYTFYNRVDLFEPKINQRVAYWYANKRIPEMLKAKKKPVTVENILIAYNAGISRVVSGRIPKTTRKYIKDYYAATLS